MRTVLLMLAMFTAAAALAWTPDLWPLETHSDVSLYTNSIANDLLSNVLVRVRSTGDTNWNLVNSVSICAGFSNFCFICSITNATDIVSRSYTNWYPMTTNIVITNRYGPFVQAGFTGSVPVIADCLSNLTVQCLAILPEFSLPFYATTNDWCFDDWFSCVGDPQADFPVASKADLIDKAPSNAIGRVLSYDTNGVLCVLPEHAPTRVYNLHGQITNGVGFFIKRKNRKNPLVVAQWGGEKGVMQSYNDRYVFGWFSPFYNLNTYPPMDPSDGASVTASTTEYADSIMLSSPLLTDSPWGESRLIDLAPTSFPSFVIIPGGSNKTFSLVNKIVCNIDDQNTSAGSFYSNNLLFRADSWAGEQQELSSLTTRADRAWTSCRTEMLGVPSNFKVFTNRTITGHPAVTNSGDHVVLQWLDPVTTYEGTKVWDNVLLPEQLDAHYFMLTNMFLAPRTDWIWTNSVLATNSAFSSGSNITIVAYPNAYHWLFESNFSDGGIWSNAACISPFPLPHGLDWWLGIVPEMGMGDSPCPWFSVMLPTMTSAVWTSNLTERVAPYFAYTLSVTGGVDQVFNGHTWFPPTNTVPPSTDTDWKWSAARTGAVAAVGVLGTSVKSQICMTNLWTGAGKRMHVYAKFNYGQATNNSPYYHRIGIYPSDFTDSSTIFSDYIDVSTNILGFQVTPETYRETAECNFSMDGEWVDRYVTNELSPINISTQLLGWTTNSWVTTWTNDVVINTDILYRDVFSVFDIAYTSYWTEVSATNAALWWQIFTRDHRHMEDGVPVTDIPGRTDYAMVSYCEDRGNNIEPTVTNGLGTSFGLVDSSDYYVGSVHVYENDYVYDDPRYAWYGSTSPVFGACTTEPYPKCDGFVLPSATPLAEMTGTNSVNAWIYCDIGGLYNYGTTSEHDWDRLSVSSNVVNGVEIRCIVEWKYP